MAELRSVPKRAGSSPPSPLLERPPTRLRATARVSWASGDSDPRLMAAVEKRARVSAGGAARRGHAPKAPGRGREAAPEGGCRLAPLQRHRRAGRAHGEQVAQGGRGPVV